MKYSFLIATVAVVSISTPVLANPAAVAGAEALAGAAAGAVSGSSSTAIGKGGTGVGVGTGGSAKQSSDNTNGNDNSVTNKSGDSRALGVALGQAPTALSIEGVCGKGTKFGFGVVEWSDYSSKCFNYQMALLAAQSKDIPVDQRWTLVNQWVERADGM